MGEPLAKERSAPAKASPVRLVILLGLLAVAVGAFAYDQFVAKPSADGASRKLEDAVIQLNAKGFDPDLSAEEKAKLRDERFVNPKKVQEILGRTPTYTEKHSDHAIEYYCWWGQVPGFNKRHYLSVVYLGKEPDLRYNTHYQNSRPPAESLPGYENVGDASAPGVNMASGAAPPEDWAKDTGEGKGKGKGKGKGGGKGLPPPGYSSEAEAKAAQPADGTEPGGAKEDSKDNPPSDSEKASEKSSDDKAGDDKADKTDEGDKPAEKPAADADAKPEE